jgi:hypothetical protein
LFARCVAATWAACSLVSVALGASEPPNPFQSPFPQELSPNPVRDVVQDNQGFSWLNQSRTHYREDGNAE